MRISKGTKERLGFIWVWHILAVYFSWQVFVNCVRERADTPAAPLLAEQVAYLVFAVLQWPLSSLYDVSVIPVGLRVILFPINSFLWACALCKLWSKWIVKHKRGRHGSD